MPIGIQFTPDAAERIVAATAKVEQGNVGSGSAILPKNDIHLRGTENWAWGKITSGPDGDGLSSWKAQRFKADGTFEDDPLQSEFDHNAFEVNGAAGNGQYCRMMYVGGSSAVWVYAVGGSGVVRIKLTSNLSGGPTATVDVDGGASGSILVHNRLGLSGPSGAIGYATLIDGLWDLIQLSCS